MSVLSLKKKFEKFVFIHISHLKDDVKIISVSSSFMDAKQRAEKFMKRHKFTDDYGFHAIEKWKINSDSESPDDVWEYNRKWVDKPERWIKIEELNAFY